MHFILLFLILQFNAFGRAKKVIDRTFPRDKDVCYIGHQRLELLLRGNSKFTEPKDSALGSYVMMVAKDKSRSLPLSKPNIDSYRFFKSESKICKKTAAYVLDQNTVAILFGKENAPFINKLSFQLFETKTLKPTTFVDTDFQSDLTIPKKDGFAFIVHSERLDMDMGKVSIQGSEYTYQDRSFPLWMSYTLKGFETDPDMTFERFPWKYFFSNKNDFFEASDWSAEKKTFSKSTIYLATNHGLKKECLLLTTGRLKLQGSESWRCYEMAKAE
jgi:hypothetical protein